MRTPDEIEASARDGAPFSNGTEGYAWQSQWCDRCLVDAPFRNGLKGATGCPLLLIALGGKTPAEWIEQPWGEHGPSLYDRYHCVEFRRPGGGGGEPRPKPEPKGMDGLFPRPERRTRMFVQPELQPERHVLERST
jgi:hypothetical protein